MPGSSSVGIYLQIDTQDAVPVASNRGWGDFLDWIGTLPASEGMALRHLAQYGWSGDIGAVVSELTTAVGTNAPKRDDVDETANGLIEALKRARGAVVSVTDGLGGEEQN